MADISTTSQTYSEVATDKIIHDPIVHDPASSPTDFVDDGLIEAIWQDLDGRVSYEKIRQTALEVAAKYVDARVMTFLTIFIRRQTMERLKRPL
jgi:hypothetical protein